MIIHIFSYFLHVSSYFFIFPSYFFISSSYFFILLRHGKIPTCPLYTDSGTWENSKLFPHIGFGTWKKSELPLPHIGSETFPSKWTVRQDWKDMKHIFIFWLALEISKSHGPYMGSFFPESHLPSRSPTSQCHFP